MAVYDALMLGANGIFLRDNSFSSYEGIGINLGIVHATCPGFLSAECGPYKETWEGLRYDIESYNWADRLLTGNSDLFNPNLTQRARIAHVYRRPLDQCLSYFTHAAHHRSKNVRKLAFREDFVTPRSFKEFLFSEGLDAYLKMHFTFLHVAERHPEQLLLLPYEKLVTNPRSSFKKILRFFGTPPEQSDHSERLQRAISLCTKTNLKKLERLAGTTLANDQTPTDSSHIHGVRANAWKKHLDSTDIDRVKSRIRELGMEPEGLL